MAYVSTFLSKSSQVSDQEFDLDQIKGKVVITKNVIVAAFQTVIVKGLTKVTGHQKQVHVLVEPSPKCKNIFIPANIVPSVQIPDRQNLKENEEAQCKSAQIDLSEEEPTQEETDPEDIL